jgi:uncharacterized membrane protein YbhN (UPF0104 family)
MEGMGVEVPLREAVVHYLMGGLIGQAIQWQLGGDVARAVEVGRRAEATSEVSVSVVLEKYAGFCALGLVAIPAALVFNAIVSYVAWSVAVPLAVTAMTLFVALTGVVLSPRLLEKTRSLGSRIPLERVRSAVDEFSHGGEAFPEFRRRYLRFLGLTILEQFVGILAFALLTKAFSVSMPLLYIVGFFPVVQFFSRLPISLQALGVREGLFVVLLGMLGFGSGTAFALSVAGRLLSLAVVGVGAGIGAMTPAWRGEASV